jgi:hypothetical protein
MHHPSLEALIASASRGCKLCALIQHTFEKNLTPSAQEDAQGKQLYIGMPPSSKLAHSQGNSELVVHSGGKHMRLAWHRPGGIIARFDICIDRSEKEWESCMAYAFQIDTKR